MNHGMIIEMATIKVNNQVKSSNATDSKLSFSTEVWSISLLASFHSLLKSGNPKVPCHPSEERQKDRKQQWDGAYLAS